MDQEIYSKKNIINGIAWKLVERFSSVGVSLIVTAVLSRLLAPEYFGSVAMVTVFVSIMTIFVTGGISNALVQKKDADELDFSTMFWVNLVVSIVLYFVLFFLSTFIANFYKMPSLSSVLRVLSLQIIIHSLNSIQCAYISKKMLFKYFFFSTLTAKLVSGVLGVVLAFLGTGVWALVVQSTSMVLFETVVLWFKIKWRPSFIFSFERIKKLYPFAWRITLMSLIEAAQNQIRNLVVGRKYSSSDLAFYEKGQLLPNTFVSNVLSALSSVMLPVLSDVQTEKERMLTILKKWVSMLLFCVAPILTILGVASDNVIAVLFGENWGSAVPFLKFACIFYLSWAFEVPIRETIKAMGYAKACLTMQIIKTLFSVFSLLVVMNKGIILVGVSLAICGIFNMAVSLFYGKKYLSFSVLYAIKIALITVLLCLPSCAAIIAISFLPISAFVKLILQIILAIAFYIIVAFVANNENLKSVIEIIRKYIK